MQSVNHETHKGRPPCMVWLGLMPPYTQEDVKQAYRLKAKTAHPDAGGSQREFNELQTVYEHAQEFVEFYGDRRHWIGKLTERYIRQCECAQALEAFGATIELDQEHWRREAMEDFSILTQIVIGIRWNREHGVEELFSVLRTYENCLSKLRLLDLGGSDYSDRHLNELLRLERLVRIDLRQTQASLQTIRPLCELPDLEVINLRRSRVSWVQTLSLRIQHRHVSFRRDSPPLDASPASQVRNVLEWSLRQ
jgi:hypothetical protein